MDSETRRQNVGAEKAGKRVAGYAEGLVYGSQCARGMMSERMRENDRYIAGTEYVLAGSPTRAFWLGFRRAMRENAWGGRS